MKSIAKWKTDWFFSKKMLHGQARATPGEKRPETTERRPLTDGTLRYKRNILAFSFGVIALIVFDKIDLSKISPFGHLVVPETALQIIGLLLLYNVVNYFVYAWIDFSFWATELRSSTFTYLRKIFGIWPDVSVLGQPSWAPNHRHRDWKRKKYVTKNDQNEDVLVFSIVTIDDDPEYSFFIASASYSRVASAKRRMWSFFFLDVLIPLLATVAAAIIIFIRLSSVQAAELPITERDQALQYRYLQVWPSEV